jgi:hypothetical protein
VINLQLQFLNLKSSIKSLIRSVLVKHLLHLIVLVLVSGSSLLLVPSSFAQSIGGPWSQPVNLSHSGAATDPIMVIDANDVIHVFWIDEFGGPMYIRGDGKQWSTPVRVGVPFEGYTPLLVADSKGYLYAFWIDKDQALRYGKILADAVPASSWNPVEILARSAVSLDVEIDSQNRISLAYVRADSTSGAAAGVYYRQSNPANDGWGDAVLLYQSPYFRSLSPEQAHVDVEIAGADTDEQLLIAWDNRPRSRVYLSNSRDGGVTWGTPTEIDKPDENGGATSPSNLTVYTQGKEVLLFWNSGSQDSGCVQYYQWSQDAGETWQPRQHLSGDLFGCSEHNRILNGQDGPILLLSSTQANLLAWDGARWSDPQIESPLTSFIDPETQKTIELGCQQVAIFADQLFVLGCDADGSGDIWWLRRGLSDTAEWFPRASEWQPLTSVTRSNSSFLSLALVSDTERRLHILWSQSSSDPVGLPDPALYYTRREGDRLWSQPVAILTSSEEPADQAAAALDPNGQLLVVWRRGEQDEIFFSYANAGQAALPSAWADPQRLSSPGQMCSAPDILVTNENEIFVVYAVPINEGRGYYLTHSADGGQTWSDPHLIFDGAAAGWAMLGHPRLAATGDNGLHLLATRYTLRSDQPQALSVAYVYSTDGGETWSQPETVAQNNVVWSYILGIGEQTVHRFWQELTAGQTTTLWHERSVDNGRTWDRIAPISSFGAVVGTPSLTWDRSGNIYLLQVVRQDTGDFVLQQWRWDGSQWSGSGNLTLDIADDTSIEDMVAAISPQGVLATVLSGRVESKDLASHEDELLFTIRSVGLAEVLPTLPPTVPAVPAITATPTLESTVQPTSKPTPDLGALTGGGGANSGSSWKGLITGAVLAGLIVAIALGFGVWKVKVSPR